MIATTALRVFLLRRAVPRNLSVTRSSYTIRYPLNGHRHRSTGSASKPILLDKPSKYNPPSHPTRLNKKSPRQYGPFLTAKEKEAQNKKRYPYMFPPEGTFMHWFLRDRFIHVWIILSTLFFLAFYTMIQEFYRTSTVAHLIPPRDTFFSNPLSYIAQCFKVYKLHTEQITIQTDERRRKKLEDVEKRRLYRQAHGMGTMGLDSIFSRNTHVSSSEASSSEASSLEASSSEVEETKPIHDDNLVDGSAVSPGEASRQPTYVDWEGKRKPVKKWFGIW